jgi:hypothetical protein
VLELFAAAAAAVELEVAVVFVMRLADFVVLECHKPLQAVDGRDRILPVVKIVEKLVVELDLLVLAVPYAVDLLDVVQLVAEQMMDVLVVG